MKTKRDLRSVQSLVNFNFVFNRKFTQMSRNSGQLLGQSSQRMPRLRPKPFPLNAQKYSSFWFALKAIQNKRFLRNNPSDNRQVNDPNCHPVNGYVNNRRAGNQMNRNNINDMDSSYGNPVEEMDIDSRDPDNEFKVFEIDAKKSLILLTNIDSNYELTFGCLRLTVLSDNFDLELNGYTLASDESMEVMAAFGHKIGIKLKPNDNANNNFSQKLESLGVKQIDSVLSQINGKSCLILIEKLCFSSILFIENISNYKPMNLKSDSVWFELKSVAKNSFDYLKVWDKLFDDLNFQSNDKIIVCGGLNTGKSSLIRHFINKYLSRKKSDGTVAECLHLDCDPGQSEFTTSAQISLTRLQKPILSSTVMNLLNNKPLMSCSVGATSASKDPKLYISSVNHLLDFYRNSLQSKGPMFVNTMGWTQDLGLALLTDIIKTTAPTHVIQIDSIVNNKVNFAFDLTPESVGKFYGFQRNSFQRNSRLNYKLTVIGSENKESKRSKLVRVSQQLTYFSKMPEIVFKPLFSMNPFKILWSKVLVNIVADTTLSPQLYLDILNCSWVQLCRINEKNHRFYSFKGIRIVDSIEGNQCLGSAVVRGIDFKNKCFYILSPESPLTVESVNCIVRPNGVHIPEDIITEQLNHSSTTDLPYTQHKT